MFSFERKSEWFSALNDNISREITNVESFIANSTVLHTIYSVAGGTIVSGVVYTPRKSFRETIEKRTTRRPLLRVNGSGSDRGNNNRSLITCNCCWPKLSSVIESFDAVRFPAKCNQNINPPRCERAKENSEFTFHSNYIW